MAFKSTAVFFNDEGLDSIEVIEGCVDSVFSVFSDIGKGGFAVEIGDEAPDPRPQVGRGLLKWLVEMGDQLVQSSIHRHNTKEEVRPAEWDQLEES